MRFNCILKCGVTLKESGVETQRANTLEPTVWLKENLHSCWISRARSGGGSGGVPWTCMSLSIKSLCIQVLLQPQIHQSLCFLHHYNCTKTKYCKKKLVMETKLLTQTWCGSSDVLTLRYIAMSRKSFFAFTQQRRGTTESHTRPNYFNYKWSATLGWVYDQLSALYFVFVLFFFLTEHMPSIFLGEFGWERIPKHSQTDQKSSDRAAKPCVSH